MSSKLCVPSPVGAESVESLSFSALTSFVAMSGLIGFNAVKLFSLQIVNYEINRKPFSG